MLFLSILFGGFVYCAITIITSAVYPTEYQNWYDYIVNAKSTNNIMSLPTVYSAYLLLGMVGKLLVLLVIFAAILSGVLGFYIASSRLLFSMSNDGLLPIWFKRLNKQSEPINSILFIFFISSFLSFFGKNVLDWIVDISALGASIGYLYTSVTTWILVKKEKRIFLKITSAIGIIISLIFILIILIPINNLNCSLGTESYVFLFIWTFLGFIYYNLTKNEE